MNALNVGTPPSTRCGISAIASSCEAEMTALRPTSTAESPAVAASHSRRPVRSERAASGEDPVPGLLNDEEGGRAAERRGNRVLEEPVGLLVAGDPGVRVDVDDARQHQQPGRVDDFARGGGEPAEPRLDRGDPPALHRHVDPRRPGRVDDRAAEDQEVRRHDALSRARRSRSPGRRPTGSAGPPRAAGRPSRPRAARSRSGSRRAGPPSTRWCTRRRGRRSRTR